MYQKTALFSAPCVAIAMALCLLHGTALAGPVGFDQINLVSDIPGEAAITDPSLLNPWGISNSASSPFWVANQAANNSTLYSAAGVKNSLVVSVAGGPTGTVFNSAGAGNFLDGGTPASFIFGTLSGSIYAWNSGNGTTAQLEASTAGATFTGLALDSNGAANFLYAANNTLSGGIAVFNSSFTQITPTGNFVDPDLPAGYEPFNIQTIGGLLYVEYNLAGPTDGTRGAGLGAVAVFDANGNFQQQLIGPGGQLNDPWGVVMAPSSFGTFGGDLLVGNFGNGEINAFNPTTGAFAGTLDSTGGTPLVNQDLWALAVSPTAPNAVYFTAGINGQKDGLFGDIVAAPEPGSLVLAGVGCVALMWVARRRLTSKTRC
jgi:uncharacterized protein (TIGR03118 family)